MEEEIVIGGLGLISLYDLTKTLPVGWKRGVDSSVSSKYSFDNNSQPIAPGITTGGSHFVMFDKWYTRLRNTLITKSCSISRIIQENKEFDKSCQAIIDTEQVKKDAINKRDEISKQQKSSPSNQVALDNANKTIKEIESLFDKRYNEATVFASKILALPEIELLLSNRYDDSDLITYIVLSEATPKRLADWCDYNPNQAKQILDFLNDINMIRLFLQSGGAKNGEYPRAIDIYYLINPNPGSTVLQRLRLAIALELCSPLCMFNSKKFVNPLERYIHYEQAYLLGELDPCFSRFNVWEMRHIINSDVTDEELTWGRECLKNYRPDIALSDNPQWRYCMIVKSDISYNVPDWYKSPKTFDQILSGGGKCGPRAWYGRFICKAFGIPTWGVKQPGHAAMTRWTTNGWCTCLGAGFHHVNWEGIGGLYFSYTTQAMRTLETEVSYTEKVRRLEWMASLHKEDVTAIRASWLPNTKSPWSTLSLFQRKILSMKALQTDVFIFPQIDVTRNIHDSVKQQKSLVEDIIKRKDDGMIIIPAALCKNPKTPNKVLFMSSFLGGKQLYIKQNGTVEYTLKSSEFNGMYTFVCNVCTVHRKGKPISLIVCFDGKMNSLPISIHPPYTVGMWKETSPVEIKLGGPGVKNTVLRIVRENEPFGFSLKDIRLTPL